MDMEIPHDLIKQVQISIQKESKIPYTPNPSSPHHQTSPLEETIAAIDRSPDHFKCAHCKARLLRDRKQSLLCVFCGRQQLQVGETREPIKFRNTIGYQWLLRALDCDGSEVVGLPVNEKELGRGQSSRKDEKTLSDLLDLEIKWPSESERLEGVLSSEGQSVLERVGVYIEDDDDDDFFPDVRADSVLSGVEIKKPVDHVQTGPSQVQGSLSLFENVQPSGTGEKGFEDKTSDDSLSGWDANFQFGENKDAGSMSKLQTDAEKEIIATETSDFQSNKNMNFFKNVQHSQSAAERSIDNETADDFSGWDAEFHSADSVALDKGSKPPDPFPSSEVDLSAHMDSVFGSANNISNVEAKDNTITSPSTNDTWFQDDMWGNSNSVKGTQGANSEMTANVEVGRDADGDNFSSFDNIDWGQQNDKLQTSSVKEYKDKAMDDNDDLFDSWSDFTSSAKSVDPSFSFQDQNTSHSQSTPEQSPLVDFFASNNNSQASTIGTAAQSDFFSDVSINKSTPREDSVIDRDASEIANTQDTAEASGKDEALLSTATTPNANDAESLISQMHDLSFMLENHITIPKS